jgi:hypothetical protein
MPRDDSHVSVSIVKPHVRIEVLAEPRMTLVGTPVTIKMVVTGPIRVVSVTFVERTFNAVTLEEPEIAHMNCALLHFSRPR